MFACLRNRQLLFPALLVLVVCSAIYPSFKHSFIPTHDGEYHIIRFWQFDTMVSEGIWFPRWAPDLNSGFGTPLFNFHYPLPNYFGVLLHQFGVSYVDSVKYVLVLGYSSAVLFCFLWLRALFDTRSSAIASVIFAYVPYWFVNLYIRGSVGECLALGFVMVAFWACETQKQIVLPLAIAGIVLSHNIIALIFVPILVLYSLIRRTGVSRVIIGVGLASYFWLPAIVEKSYMVSLGGVEIADHFSSIYKLIIPSWGTGFSGGDAGGSQMSLQLGIIPISLAMLYIAMVLRKKIRLDRLEVFVLGVWMSSVYMMLPISEFLWQRLPLVRYIQYPWRLLSITIVASGFIAARLASRPSLRKSMILVAMISVVVTYSYSRPVEYEPRNDQHYLTRKNFTDSTGTMGNAFYPVWSSWFQERSSSLGQIEHCQGNVAVSRRSPIEYAYTIEKTSKAEVSLNVLYYPGWQVYVDNEAVHTYPSGRGLVTFVADGQNTAGIVRFEESFFRQLSNIISIICLFWLVSLFILKYIYENWTKRITSFKRS